MRESALKCYGKDQKQATFGAQIKNGQATCTGQFSWNYFNRSKASVLKQTLSFSDSY